MQSGLRRMDPVDRRTPQHGGSSSADHLEMTREMRVRWLWTNAAVLLLARKEERQMVDRFGDEYLSYQQRVPMFVPRRSEWRRLFQVSSASTT